MFLAAVAVVLWERRKARKTMEEIERMLDAAMTGSFSETNFDESRLSALETKFAHYLSAAEASSRNVAQEKDKIKSLIADITSTRQKRRLQTCCYTASFDERKLCLIGRRQMWWHCPASNRKSCGALIDSLIKKSFPDWKMGSFSPPAKGALQPLLESVSRTICRQSC